MQGRLTRQNAFAALLLAISILSLTPTLAHADQQDPSYPLTIDAPDQAAAIGNGPSGGKQTASSTMTTITSSSNDSASTANATNQTQTDNSTVTSPSLLSLSQTTTETSITNVTSTYAANSTLPAEITTSNATHSAILNGNVSAPYIPQASGNVTVTVTQYLSETTSTTQTVANVTISYTVITTVANTTITQANMTTTVTATTGT